MIRLIFSNKNNHRSGALCDFQDNCLDGSLVPLLRALSCKWISVCKWMTNDWALVHGGQSIHFSKLRNVSFGPSLLLFGSGVMLTSLPAHPPLWSHWHANSSRTLGATADFQPSTGRVWKTLVKYSESSEPVNKTMGGFKSAMPELLTQKSVGSTNQHFCLLTIAHFLAHHRNQKECGLKALYKWKAASTNNLLFFLLLMNVCWVLSLCQSWG